MDLGTVLRRGRGLAYEVSGSNRRARARLDGSRACILNYHRVIPERVARRDAVEGGMYVTPESFRMQIETLKELFCVIPLGELAERVRDGGALPARAAAITFDDGWRDNLDHALPELERAGLPATIFVVTERVGSVGPFWPDEVCRRLAPLSRDAVASLARELGVTAARADAEEVLEHLKSLPEAERPERLERLREATELPGEGEGEDEDEQQLDEPQDERELLTWEELETLRDAGIGIESHGETHAILTGLGREQAEAELRGSLRTLRDRGFAPDALFAYPSGRHDARLHEIAAAVGYRSAFVLDERLAQVGMNPMAVSRLGMHEGIGASRLEFLCKVPGRS